MAGAAPMESQSIRFDPIPGDPPYKLPPEKLDKIIFWTVHPKAKAWGKCQEMEGIKYWGKPERPPPNCKCEIRENKYKPKKRYFSGFIEGFEGNAVYQFYGFGHVKVTIEHKTGALASGVYVQSNHDGHRRSHTLTKNISFDFNKPTETPIFWSIHIIQLGAANTMIQYWIEYEE